jgi:hypothetical protein
MEYNPRILGGEVTLRHRRSTGDPATRVCPTLVRIARFGMSSKLRSKQREIE